MQNGNSIAKHVYAVFLSDLVIFIKNVSYTITFRNPYFVKSGNLAFTHFLFRSAVYHDVAQSYVKV